VEVGKYPAIHDGSVISPVEIFPEYAGEKGSSGAAEKIYGQSSTKLRKEGDAKTKDKAEKKLNFETPNDDPKKWIKIKKRRKEKKEARNEETLFN
jgi:hypothetical protein